MRNVQVWSVVAALIVANCCFGQLLRSRRHRCQPSCPTCNCVSNATFTESSGSTPVYAENVSYEQVISEPVVSTQSYEVPLATAVSETQVVPVSYAASSDMALTDMSYKVKSTPRVTRERYSATYENANSDQMRVLSVVNRKRQRSGLAPLVFDANLASVAQRKSYYRASRGMTGHDGTNMGGASVEGVGFSYGQADPVEGFNTCYLYSNGYQRCGCAISYDANNRAYYTLLLR